MKYSEAIRLGSMLYPQSVGLAVRTPDGYAVCANGAAALALGFSVDSLLEASLYIAPEAIAVERPLLIGAIKCPVLVCKYMDLGWGVLDMCAHLNDKHWWTRERIADWLAASGHDFEIDLSKPECAPAAEPVAAGVAE